MFGKLYADLGLVMDMDEKRLKSKKNSRRVATNVDQSSTLFADEQWGYSTRGD